MARVSIAGSFAGIVLLDFGLMLMLVSYLFAYGLGLRAGVFAAVAAPLLVTGIVLDRTWARLVAFAVGMTMGGGWLYAALAWD